MHEPGFQLTPQAEADLKAISRYTYRKWGPLQQERYLRQFQSFFVSTTQWPNRGRPRPDIGPSVRMLLFSRQFWIYYHQEENFISIDRILHVSRDEELAIKKP